MNQISSSAQRTQAFNLEHFRIRLTARLGIILVCLAVFIPRLPVLIADSSISSEARLFIILSLPFPLLMIFTILFEYFLYRKLGSKIVKYSSLVDIVLLFFFMGDWMMVLVGSVHKIQHTNDISFQIEALYGFTTFSWRTLLVTLIVQKWQLKIIAPVFAVLIATGYAVHYIIGTRIFIVITAVIQIFNISTIIYFEDKVKWKMMWANIQKDKWMQVNNFILDSLPENIMILGMNGEAKFISEYCKSFVKDCNLPLDVKDFFKRVQGLRRYERSGGSSIRMKIQTERLATGDGQIEDLALEDVINNFQDSIIKKEINEREFQAYNGKLKIEGDQEISLEVKISFVQHFENHYIILILRDTTQRNLLIALEETNKYKDQLLASVSHELRAPLNGNINLVESAVNSCQIPDKVKESCLIPALRSSKFLLHLINDILDMSQIKEKKLRLVFRSESLKETLKSTTQLVELQAKKKGIELLLEIDPAVPKSFCTDHIRLSQIILNLVNNAIKFTSKGAVVLRAKPHKGEPNFIEISVEDSGIGMSQENVKKLFSYYTHIEFEGRQAMNPTGIGLGLNIAYNLAVLLGPQDQQGIRVTSIPHQGSTFTFTLENKQTLVKSTDSSCEVDEESPKLCHPTTLRSTHSIDLIVGGSESSPFLKNSCLCPKVLIVDDNPFNTMACETILGSLEIKCASVYSGSACLESLLNRQTKKFCGENCEQYAVVLMDQEMPGMNGSETVREILRLQSQNLLSKSIKVIGCTAHKSKEEMEKFMQAGVEKCISKPISGVIIEEILKGTV